MQEAMKNCPFCGSDSTFTKYYGAQYGRIYYVGCAICGGRTRGVCRPWKYIPERVEDDEHEWDCTAAVTAKTLWNKRSGADAEQNH